MKKIITLIGCVALAASALAQGPVSANIVGYAKLSLATKNVLMFGAVFKDIPSVAKTLNIQEIFTDADEWGITTLSWWDGAKWINATWGDGAWVDLISEEPVVKTFAVGEGFKFYSELGDTVTVKGELYTSSPVETDIELSLQNNVEILVNPMPAELDIQDIGTDADEWGITTLSWWDGAKWINATWGDGAWVDIISEEPVVKTFAVGEGFKFYSLIGDKLLFPNPLAE